MVAELSAPVCKSMIDDAIYEALTEIADYNPATVRGFPSLKSLRETHQRCAVRVVW